MTLSPVGEAPSAGTTQPLAKATADYQTFLKLLVAEMKNQDPTDPVDSTQYVAQLAAFSQVEQSVQINGKLERLLQASALAQADAIIGRTLTSLDGLETGIVREVRLTQNGLVALLDSGAEVPVEPGVTIR
jgi:flagellar basal-body rod modification protein FlgD